jgi:hypothetical protein
MNTVSSAALIQVFISLVVVAFQLALAAGAPWGEYTMGGRNLGRLPKPMRVVAAVSACIMLAQAGHYLAQAGLLDRLLSPNFNGVVNWIWVAFSVLGLLMNAISRSKKERRTWVPVLLVSVCCTLLVAVA